MHEPPSPSPYPRIAKFYDELLGRYGHDPRSCDYGSAASQLVKFKVLSEVTDLRGRRILDVGCGLADYAQYLAEHVGSVDYHGIDLSPRMIEEATRLRPQLSLRNGNLLDFAGEQYDVVNANGIFYLLGERAPALMQQLVSKMYQCARIAVAFNSLSAWAAVQEPDEFYADPLETVAFCRSLSPWVVLRHDHLPHDFCVYLYRNQIS
jgi:SAM-dependent methyltransferase